MAAGSSPRPTRKRRLNNTALPHHYGHIVVTSSATLDVPNSTAELPWWLGTALLLSSGLQQLRGKVGVLFAEEVQDWMLIRPMEIVNGADRADTGCGVGSEHGIDVG